MTATTTSDPNRLPSCIGAHTTRQNTSGRSFTRSKTSCSQAGTPWLIATTTQVPANTIEPPSTATTSPRRTCDRFHLDTVRLGTSIERAGRVLADEQEDVRLDAKVPRDVDPHVVVVARVRRGGLEAECCRIRRTRRLHRAPQVAAGRYSAD